MRRFLAAVLCAVIAGVAGLLGIGGGELRLPVLLSFLGLAVRAAIAVNLGVGVATLATSFVRRASEGALAEVQPWAALVWVFVLASLLGSAIGVLWANRSREAGLATALRIYLFAIGALLILEAFFHFPQANLGPDDVGTLIIAGACGVAIGWIATVFGVAGGEMRIPVLIFVFGIPIKVAGTISTIVALPAVLFAFVRFARGGHVKTRSTWSLIVILGLASVIGATVGVTLLPAVSDTFLRLLLAFVLLVSALRLRPKVEEAARRRDQVADAAIADLP